MVTMGLALYAQIHLQSHLGRSHVLTCHLNEGIGFNWNSASVSPLFQTIEPQTNKHHHSKTQQKYIPL